MPTSRQLGVALNLIVPAIVACWAAIGTVSNSPATPAPESNSECNVAPRSPEDIAILLADPDIATPAATTAGQTLPAGISVSAETANAIEQVVRTWLACQNDGDPLRAWALFSDGYLYRLLARQGVPESISLPAATPDPNAAGGAVLLEIHGERELPDGRLGATVVIAYPAVPMPKTFFFSLVEVDGRLLIDGILGEISFSVP